MSLQIDEEAETDRHGGGPTVRGMGVPTDSSTPNKRAGNRTPSTLEQEVATKVKRLRKCTDGLFMDDDENEGGEGIEDMGVIKSPQSKTSSPSLYSQIVELLLLQPSVQDF